MEGPTFSPVEKFPFDPLKLETWLFVMTSMAA
jgi:hypothetical protein